MAHRRSHPQYAFNIRPLRLGLGNSYGKNPFHIKYRGGIGLLWIHPSNYPKI